MAAAIAEGIRYRKEPDSGDEPDGDQNKVTMLLFHGFWPRAVQAA
jgi:hypothetical protein